MIEQFIISRGFVLFIEILVVFVPISVWALFIVPRKPIGYGLGWVFGLFFILIYSSRGGIEGVDNDQDYILEIWQIILAILGGGVFGLGINALAAAIQDRISGKSIRIATFTALTVILTFLTYFERGDLQRMAGIAILTSAIVSLYLALLFGVGDEPDTPPAENANGIPRAQDLQSPTITISNTGDTANQPSLPPQPTYQLPPTTAVNEIDERRREEIRNRVRNRGRR